MCLEMRTPDGAVTLDDFPAEIVAGTFFRADIKGSRCYYIGLPDNGVVPFDVNNKLSRNDVLNTLKVVRQTMEFLVKKDQLTPQEMFNLKELVVLSFPLLMAR